MFKRAVQFSKGLFVKKETKKKKNLQEVETEEEPEPMVALWGCSKMNVLSLPDEMLASVLKYKSSEKLTKLRKVSSKIDSVARRYGLDKMKIEKLLISCCEKEVKVRFLEDGEEFTLPLSTDLLDGLGAYNLSNAHVRFLRPGPSRLTFPILHSCITQEPLATATPRSEE